MAVVYVNNAAVGAADGGWEGLGIYASVGGL